MGSKKRRRKKPREGLASEYARLTSSRAGGFAEFARTTAKDYHPHTCRYCGTRFFHTQEGDCWKTKYKVCPSAECARKEDEWLAQGDLDFTTGKPL